MTEAAPTEAVVMSRRVRVERIAALGQLGLQIAVTLSPAAAEGLPDPVVEAVAEVLDAAGHLVEVADTEARFLDEARDLG